MEGLPGLTRLAVALLLLTSVSVTARAQEEEATDSSRDDTQQTSSSPTVANVGWWREYVVDLTRLGQDQGVVLEGTSDAADIFFPVPQDAGINAATLELRIEFSTSLSPQSGITVSLNGTPRRSLLRESADENGSLWLQLPLQPADLRSEYLQVRLDASLLLDTDRCVNSQLRGAFARVLPESGTRFQMSNALPASIEAAWDILPRVVSIGIDTTQLDPEQFAAALAIATELDRGGHEVHIKDLSELSPIIIASPKRFEAAFGGRGIRRGDGKPWSAKDTADLELLQASPDGQPVIWLPSTQASKAAALLSGPWRKVARHVQISVDTAQPWRPDRTSTGVLFSELGLVDSSRSIADQTTWRVTLEQDRLGAGRVPESIELLMVSAPGPTNSKALAHVYFNDRLLQSKPLDNRGGIQRVPVALPQSLLRARNRVEITVQRRTEGGDCRLDAPNFPVQLLPESRVITTAAPEGINSFAEFVPHAAYAVIYLPETALKAPQRVIPFLIALGSSFWPSGVLPALKFYGPEEDFKPAGTFILVGDPAKKPRGPVEFDRGGIQIRASRSNQVVLDVSSLPNWNILQLADWQGQRGLWLKSHESFSGLPTTDLFLEDENVAILNQKGVAFALRNSPHAAVKIAYTGSSRWQALFQRYRLPIFIALWILLAILITYLLRMSRRHSNGGDK